MTTERILRGMALLIAVVAFIDPALTRAARDRPTVVVLQGGSSTRDLARDVAKALEPAFDVSRLDVPGALAYVVAGTDLPDDWRPPANARVFSVTVSATAPVLKILRFDAPAEVSLDSIAPIEVEVQSDDREREVAVSLIADGVQLTQTTHRIAGVDTRIRVPMAFVPSHTGIVRLRVEAAVLDREPAVADRVIDVHARAWQVLAFDGRPSYAATFVRRALEADPRFKVTTRVVTSRASAIQTNVAPSTLTDPVQLAVFDLIVVGGLEAMGEAEASALQRYLRDRRGGVILLPERSEGLLLRRLTGQSSWQDDRRTEPARIGAESAIPATPGGASDAWTASEFLWPARWPPLAETLATLTQPPRASAAASGRLSAVWQMPVGAGRLAVSSAIDGWRSRTGTSSGFSGFWRMTAAALAQATPPAVEVRMPRRLLTPGEPAHVSVATFAGGEPVAQVTGDSMAGVRLWPLNAPTAAAMREWTGSFRAADLPGRYRITVTGAAGAQSVVEFLVVSPDGVQAPVIPAAERDGLAALAASAHGGKALPAEDLSQLAAQIAEGVQPAQTTEAWRPMRSVWWMLPFSLCAAGEWWLRRHRGER